MEDRMDGWMGGRMDGWTDGRDSPAHVLLHNKMPMKLNHLFLSHLFISPTYYPPPPQVSVFDPTPCLILSNSGVVFSPRLCSMIETQL